jgi:hypothetical protein
MRAVLVGRMGCLPWDIKTTVKGQAAETGAQPSA